MIIPDGYDLESQDPTRAACFAEGGVIVVLGTDLVHSIWAASWIGLQGLPYDLLATLVTAETGAHYLMGRVQADLTGAGPGSSGAQRDAMFPIGVCYEPGVDLAQALSTVPRVLAITSTIFGITDEADLLEVSVNASGIEALQAGIEKLALDHDGWDVKTVLQTSEVRTRVEEERS